MHVDDLIRYYNGMVNWIYSQNVEINKPTQKPVKDYNSKSARHFIKYDNYLNKILLRFGKENNIKMTKCNSYGYKGSFRPILHNCEVVQENWFLFKKWILQNYPKNTL